MQLKTQPNYQQVTTFWRCNFSLNKIWVAYLAIRVFLLEWWPHEASFPSDIMHITLHLPAKHIGLPELSLLPLHALFFSALTLIFSWHPFPVALPVAATVLCCAAQPAFHHRLSPLLWERPPEILKQNTEVILRYQLNTGAAPAQECSPQVLRHSEELKLLYTLWYPPWET